MKNTETIKFIKNVVTVARNVGVDTVIIEKELIRGVDEERKVVINELNNIPDLPFEALAIPSLTAFLNRMNIADTFGDFDMEFVLREGRSYVQQVKMKASRSRIEVRCANPDDLQVPKRVKDVFVHEVTIDEEAMTLIKNGSAAMSNVVVSMISDATNLTLKITDINNDVLEQKIDKCVTKINEGNDKFAFRYPVKVLLSMFKGVDEFTFQVGEKGILRTKNNGINVYILPLVQ